MNSGTYHYKKGVNQLFTQTSHVFDPSLYNEEDLMYNPDREVSFIDRNFINDDEMNDVFNFFFFADYSNGDSLRCGRRIG